MTDITEMPLVDDDDVPVPAPAITKALPSLFRCVNCNANLPAVEQLRPPTNCPHCNASFVSRSAYADMATHASGDGDGTSSASAGVFQWSQVSYMYERGWRSQFKRAGFPGVSKEADLALLHLFPTTSSSSSSSTSTTHSTSIVVDLSCGTGIVSRELMKRYTGKDLHVVACDLSASMLIEAAKHVRQSKSLTTNQKSHFSFIKCDAAALPFRSQCLHAVHCSAAIHCWPDLTKCLAEVYRCMAPSGRLFVTAFLNAPYWPRSLKSLIPLVERMHAVIPVTNTYRFYTAAQLSEAFTAARFEDVQVEERDGCAIIRCCKHESHSSH